MNKRKTIQEIEVEQDKAFWRNLCQGIIYIFGAVVFFGFIGWSITTPQHKGGAKNYEERRIDIRNNDSEFSPRCSRCNCKHDN